jgi:hypothetical protein
VNFHFGSRKVGRLKIIAQNPCVTFVVATNGASNESLEFAPTGFCISGCRQKISAETFRATLEAAPKTFCQLSLRFRVYSAKIV